MKKIILICIMICASYSSIQATAWCDCAKFTAQTECNNVVDCVWGTNCGTKACSAVTADQCDYLEKCTLNNASTCETTAACSTYSVTNRLDCMIFKGDCGSSATQTNGQYTCATYTKATCTALTADTCNYSYVDEQNFCWLGTDGKCAQFKWSTCVGIPMDVCARLECDASGTTCATPTCSSITKQAECTVIDDGIFGAQVLCQWDTTNSKCIERTSLSDLTQDTCSLNTDGGYYWSNSACTTCADTDTGSSYATKLLSLVALVIIIQ